MLTCFKQALKEKVSLTLDMTVLERLHTLAEDSDRSLSSYVNLVLRDHLENQESVEPSRRNILHR
ncbi:TraY domain-containing protein [uncultured Intestinimonas sp.]|uniref:TraY domain-containing protein n=1 Tax=uncultured Intestinimonas sp. TaxID=1689265 RepID=UPI0025E843AE|nr:TraY domain-containing protein [uncultured Intestinimonas sp.]